jgi:magnesium-transporting ATPase (P-type)
VSTPADYADVLCRAVLCPGDHALTGLAIGKMLNIAGSNKVITGPEIDNMSDEYLRTVS